MPGDANPADSASRPADLPENPFLTYSPDTALPPSLGPRLSFLKPGAETLTAWNASQPSPNPEAADLQAAQDEDLAHAITLPSAPNAGTSQGDGEEAEAARSIGPSYELIRVVGRGGMGEVWEARQGSLRRLVAVKKIRPDYLAELASQESQRLAAELEFFQEALTSASLEHPNIVPVHDLGRGTDGLPLLAMKLVKGQTWNDVLKEDFRLLPVPEFLAKHLPILIDVSQAVAYAHARGVVHRDIKPAQVMLGEFGEVLLMDWGLAIGTGDIGSQAPNFVPTPAEASGPAGTPALMAPEQTQESAENVGPWTDVYSLGGTLYWLLAGMYPHQGKGGAMATFERAARGEVPPPATRVPGRTVPPELSDLAMKALAKAPRERVTSAMAFVEALRDYLSGASRRAKARELATQAAERLENAETYESFSACLELLGQAEALCPGLEEADKLLPSAHAGYAQAALAKEDLALARLHAEALAPGPRRDQALKAVAKAEDRRGHRERQRKIALAISVVLALAVIIGLGFFTHKLAAQRDLEIAARQEAVEQRDLARQAQERALAARDEAAELAADMVADLRAALEPIGRLQLLSDTAKRSLEYFDKVPPAERTTEGNARHANAMLIQSKVLFDRGETREPIRLAREASAILEPLIADPAKAKKAWMRDFCLARGVIGMALRQEGRLEGAELAMREVPLRLLPFMAAHTPEAERRPMPNIIPLLGVQFGAAMDPEQARLIREIQDRVLEGALFVGLRPNEIATGMESAGEVLIKSGQPAGAEMFFLDGLDLCQMVIDEEPLAAPVLRQASRLRANLGRALELQGKSEEARKQFGLAEDLGRRAMEANAEDPRNALALANALNHQAGNLQKAGDARSALVRWREALPLTERAARLDLDNERWRDEFANNARQFASALSEAGLAEEAATVRAKAAAAARAAVEAKPETIEAWRALAKEFAAEASAESASDSAVP